MTDDYLTDAFDAVDNDHHPRFMADARALVDAMRSSPTLCEDPTFEVGREALIRHVNDDPTWPLWLAWLRHREVEEAFAELFPELAADA